MLGVVLVTHFNIGREMIRTVEGILKEKVPILTVEMDLQLSLEQMRAKIETAVEKFSDKEGVLILTDIFGATPTNLCRIFSNQKRVAILTGINLPIVLKAATAAFEGSAQEAAEFLKKYGSENIRTCP